MKVVVAAAALAAIVAGCGGAHGKSLRFDATHVHIAGDGSLVVLGTATSGRDYCEPAEMQFASVHLDAAGRVLATDTLAPDRGRACAAFIADLAEGVVTGWSSTPERENSGGTRGPSYFSVGGDGRLHALPSRRDDRVYGPYAVAKAGGMRAVMSTPNGGDSGPLVLEVVRAGVHTSANVTAVPAGADLYGNSFGQGTHDLAIDPGRGVYGLIAWTRGGDSPYYYALFRHRLDGRRDGSFGTLGRVFARVPGVGHFEPTQLAVQRDGKIVVVGGGARSGRRVTCVLRFRAGGHRDVTFGRRGVVALDTGRDDKLLNESTGVAVGRGGKLVVVASTDEAGARVWRLLPGGRRDTRFGKSGVVRLPTVPA